MLLAVPAAQAGHAVDEWSYEGEILAPNPAAIGDPGTGVSREAWEATGDQTLDGADGDVVELPDWAPGHRLWANGTSAAPFPVFELLQVRFYDEDREFLGHGDPGPNGTPCDAIGQEGDQVCDVPERAGYAVVEETFAGANTDFELTIISGDLPPGEERRTVYSLAGFRTSWAETALEVVIVPPVTGPVVDREGTVFPNGTGLATESPYVDATEDGVKAWEAGIDAYIERNESASFLDAFRFDVGVVGEDRDVQDFQRADVQIVYTPTTSGILGTAQSSETASDPPQDTCRIVLTESTPFSLTPNDMYNLAAHEFGHCMAMGHVSGPDTDLMDAAYQHRIGEPGNDRVCLSTLDLAVLARVYDWIGQDQGWEAVEHNVVSQTAEDYELLPDSIVDGDGDGCQPTP